MIGAFYRLLNVIVKIISDREHSLRFATFAYMRYFFVTNREKETSLLFACLGLIIVPNAENEEKALFGIFA